MVTEGEGGYSSDSGSDSSCGSDLSDTHLDTLVDDIIGKLSIYSEFHKGTMTIKNRKERTKTDRACEWDAAGPSSTTGRHSHGYKPYAFVDDRKEGTVHRARVRTGHSHESSLLKANESPGYQGTPSFPRPQPRPSGTQSDYPVSPFECRSNVREPIPIPSAPSPKVDKENGNNSEDEYNPNAHPYRGLTPQTDETNLEKLLMEKKGWKIVIVQADGACLFRSVSHQIFGDEEKHDVVRKQVVDYMLQNREHFSPYVTEEFDHYIDRKRSATCYGNHIEIQAIAELYNRPVEIYHDSVEPINVFHAEYSKEFPIRLSYHGRVHYNSVVDPFKPSFGHGLGMPDYQPNLAEPDLIARAVCESEASQIEEAMLRDKMAETEQSEMERCMEAQAVRESYLDYLKQLQLPVRSNLGSSSSNLAIGTLAPVVRSTASITSPIDVASSSTATSRTAVPDPTVVMPLPSSSHLHPLPPDFRGMDEDSIVAMVMEQSRHEYLESLRKKRMSPSFESQDPHSSPNISHGFPSANESSGARTGSSADSGHSYV
ncbi:OTU domain-containing protein 5-A [Paragonimus heterotremus]|uniref:ubiquitinyl hydrolase 1 n=1 Tax=Paragonimus heterotremus TaxID=100268 RepID=A0A8J4T7R0_9TREM|nr:OTU domain-containing protein 5-A [Paragonimus heterotremus]